MIKLLAKMVVLRVLLLQLKAQVLNLLIDILKLLLKCPMLSISILYVLNHLHVLCRQLANMVLQFQVLLLIKASLLLYDSLKLFNSLLHHHFALILRVHKPIILLLQVLVLVFKQSCFTFELDHLIKVFLQLSLILI